MLACSRLQDSYLQRSLKIRQKTARVGEREGRSLSQINRVYRSIVSFRRPLYSYFKKGFVGKNVHATVPKGNMGYDQYTVPDTVAVEPYSDASL